MKEMYDSRNDELGFIPTLQHLFLNSILIFELARVELFQKYKGSVLGIFWSFLNPLLITTVIYFVFGRLFNSYMPENRGYAVWVYSGILLQILLIQGLTIAASAIQKNLSIITKNRIRPIIMGFASSLAHSINFLLGSIIIIPLCFLTNQQLSWRMILIPLYVFLSAAFLTGFGLLVVGLFMKYDDTVFVFNAAIMVLSYLTPIFYPLDILSGKLHLLISLNPLTSWVSTLRWIFLDEAKIEIYNLLYVFGTSISLLFIGSLMLRSRWKIWQML